jgi:hypothetical protein
MRQKDRRRAVVRDLRHQAVHVVDAGMAEGELVAEPAEPDPLAAGKRQPHRVVLEHRQPGGLECGAHPRPVMPPVVIAEHGMDTERRAKLAERRAPVAHRDRPGVDPVEALDEVAEEHHQIGRQRVGRRDDLLDALDRHPWPAGVDVGDDRDAKRGVRVAPVRRGDGVARHHRRQRRLHCHGMARQRERNRGGTQEKRAARQHARGLADSRDSEATG